jgi:hypothetical protein
MAQIFLFGNLRASLTLARSLSRAGHVVHAGVDDPDPYLFASRHVKGVLHHARPDSTRRRPCASWSSTSSVIPRSRR